jgi:hypothetical protein
MSIRRPLEARCICVTVFCRVHICERVGKCDWHMPILDCCIEYIVYARYNVFFRTVQFGLLNLNDMWRN